jgi:hypothetical protein
MACPYLLASILFHEDWLREHLPHEHSIFQSRVFNNNPYLDELKKHIRTGEGYSSDTGDMYVIYSICMTGLSQACKRRASLPTLPYRNR